MSEAKFTPVHTPGPWRAHERLSGSENHKGWIVMGALRGPVGEVYPLNSDPTPAARANARLIAAAPALYEAATKARTELEVMLSMRPERDGGLYREALDALTAALDLVDAKKAEST